MPKVPSEKSSASKTSSSNNGTRSEAQIAYSAFVKEMTSKLKVEKPDQKPKARKKEISKAWKTHPSNPKAVDSE